MSQINYFENKISNFGGLCNYLAKFKLMKGSEVGKRHYQLLVRKTSDKLPNSK